VSCRVVARVAGPAGPRSLHLHLSTPRTLARPRNGVRPVRRSAADGARPGEKAGGLLTSARVSSVRRWSRARRGLEPSGFARRRRCVARTGSFPLSRLSCRPRVNGHDSASCDDATCRANKTNGIHLASGISRSEFRGRYDFPVLRFELQGRSRRNGRHK
jgi:hypothetical protein